MKKIFAVCLMFVFTLAVSAQNQQRGQGQRPDFTLRYDTMKTELGLKDSQIDSIKKFDQERMTKSRELFEKYPDDRDKVRAESTKLMDQRNEKVKAVLTKEQYEKFQKFEAARRPFGGGQRGQGGGGGNRGGGGGNRNN